MEAARQRAVGDLPLQRASIRGADQPDSTASLELDVVGAAAEDAWILEGAFDAGAVAVDGKEDVLVVAKVVTVTDGGRELLDCEALGSVASLGSFVTSFPAR